MRRRIIFLIFLLGIIAILTLASCNGGMYSVTFDSNGGTEVEAQNALFGRVVEPDEPVREGYTFKGWYLDDKKWNFMTDTVSGDTTLKASWKLDKYDVTYKGLISGASNSNPLHYTVETSNKKLSDPIVPFGYTFGGWYDENGNQVTSLSYGDITLTAKIEAFPELAPFEFKSLEDSVEIIMLKDKTARSVHIPDCVTSIEGMAFQGCSKLDDVYISDLAMWCSLELKGYLASPFQYADNLYLNDALVTELIIPDGVTEIKDGVFYGCKSITRLVLPDTLLRIGNGAFEYCTRLRSVSIPDSVTEISDLAFSNCNWLMSVKIGKNVSSIGENAFSGSSRLVEIINISNLDINTDSFGLSALEIHRDESKIATKDGYYFYSCDEGIYLLGSIEAPTELVLPDNFNGYNYYIYDGAFKSRDEIAFLVIPDGVTGIGKSAFYSCSRLHSVTIGKDLAIIEEDAFSNCNKLIEVINHSGLKIAKEKGENGNIGANAKEIVFNGVSNINRIDGFLFYTHDGVHYLLDYIGEESSIVFPESYNGSNYVLSDYLCAYNTVRHIVINGGVTEIPDNAFNASQKLTTVTIGDNVKSIGKYAFYNCRMLKSIVIGDGVTEIKENAFWNCRVLTDVKIGASLEKFSYDSFRECYLMERITVHENNQTFSTEDGILFSKDGTELYIFPSGKSGTVYYIPEKVTKIHPYAFSWNKLLTGIEIHDGVLEIGSRAFEYCSEIKRVTVGVGVRRIGIAAFYDCHSLSEIVLKDPSGWVIGSVSTKVPVEQISDPRRTSGYFCGEYRYFEWWKP